MRSSENMRFDMLYNLMPRSIQRGMTITVSVGRFRGVLGHVNVVSSLIFSGMSGSAVADVVGIGKLTMEMMTKGGRYTASYAAAITAATAVIGPIIPPSIPLVLYALISDTSVGYLFAAGVVSGLIMTVAMMGLTTYLAHTRNFPVKPPAPVRELIPLTLKALPAFMMPVVLLGGIYSGVMTPTEAAAVAALYTLVISVVLYRSVTPGGMYKSLVNSGRQMSSVGILIPAAKALGIDMVHFGLVVNVNLMIGLITPAYGLLFFIVANKSKQPLMAVIKDTIPFIIVLIASLAFLTFVPDAVLWIPRTVGYKG